MKTILSIFPALFIMMDFIGTVPVFLSLTQSHTTRSRVVTAIKGSLFAGLIVALFAISGKSILDYFGLSIEALKVGGGILFLLIALEMIFFGQSTYEQGSEKRDITISPLAIPMLAGPGSMSFAMIAFTEAQQIEKIFVLIGILFAVSLGSITLSLSELLMRLLGKNIVRGIEKISAILLATIALEMIMSGIKIYFSY